MWRSTRRDAKSVNDPKRLIPTLFPLSASTVPNLRQRRKLVFNNSQATDDYDIRAAECGGNRRRAGGGQDLHFTRHEGLDAGRPARV